MPPSFFAIRQRNYRTLSGWILDAQTEAKLPGVNVEILDGANAGRTILARADGSYQLDDLEPGTFTIRFSKTGYATADRSFYLTGDRFTSLDVRLTK